VDGATVRVKYLAQEHNAMASVQLLLKPRPLNPESDPALMLTMDKAITSPPPVYFLKKIAKKSSFVYGSTDAAAVLPFPLPKK